MVVLSMASHNEEVKASKDVIVTDNQRVESRHKLEQWLNKSMRIKMTDGRTLIGIFLCTDRDCNIIMGSCEEYLKPTDTLPKEEPRILGLAMIPGKHVLSIEIDEISHSEESKSPRTTDSSEIYS